MLKSILIPLDGTEATNSAIVRAIKFAKLHGAKLTGIGIIDEPGIKAPQAGTAGTGSIKNERDSAMMADAESKVKQFVKAFDKQCEEQKIEFNSFVKTGDPYLELVREAERHDMIVTSRYTNFYFETTDKTGKTFKRLVRESQRPVIAVQEGSEAKLENPILICYDGSLQASQAMQLFSLLLMDIHKDVCVVTVHSDKEKVERINKRAVDYLESRGANVKGYAVTSSADTFEVIYGQIEIIDPLAIVMGAYGKKGLRDFFFGSSTQQFIEKCPLPIFIYH